MKNRDNMVNPEVNSWKGGWHNHCGCGVNPYEVSFLEMFFNFKIFSYHVLFRYLPQSHLCPDWKLKVPAKFEMTSNKELFDHTIAEGDRLFSNTRFKDTWMIYHDSLPQWWEKGSQGQIEEHGFKHK